MKQVKRFYDRKKNCHAMPLQYSESDLQWQCIKAHIHINIMWWDEIEKWESNNVEMSLLTESPNLNILFCHYFHICMHGKEYSVLDCSVWQNCVSTIHTHWITEDCTHWIYSLV